MQRILITGAEGFIGKSLIELLDKTKYELIPITRKQVDLTNKDQVIDFFENTKNIDFVIHCATVGGRRETEDGPRIFYQNTKMFENLILFKSHYKLMITFGSGAELREGDFPLNYYGLSKKYITEKIIRNNLNCVNIRLWGCFGKYEPEDRFIKANMRRYKANQSMIIHNNIIMDFFYVNDIVNEIHDILDNWEMPFKKELNFTYNNHLFLSDIAEYINILGDHRVEIKINNEPINGNKDYWNKSKQDGIPFHDEKRIFECIKEMYGTL